MHHYQCMLCQWEKGKFNRLRKQHKRLWCFKSEILAGTAAELHFSNFLFNPTGLQMFLLFLSPQTSVIDWYNCQEQKHLLSILRLNGSAVLIFVIFVSASIDWKQAIFINFFTRTYLCWQLRTNTRPNKVDGNGTVRKVKKLY